MNDEEKQRQTEEYFEQGEIYYEQVDYAKY
jgi:hypothetical protein